MLTQVGNGGILSDRTNFWWVMEKSSQQITAAELRISEEQAGAFGKQMGRICAKTPGLQGRACAERAPSDGRTAREVSG